MNATAVPMLPPEFSELERFVPGWGDASTNARHHHRHMSAMDDIRAFYDALGPRLQAIFTHLDAFDVWALPSPEQHLLNLTFGYIEAALAVEIFGEPGVPGVPYPHGYFAITRELR